MSRGANRAPNTRAAVANTANLAASSPTSPKSALPVVATPERTVSRITATKSSTTRMPTIIRALGVVERAGVPQHLDEDGGTADGQGRAQEYPFQWGPTEELGNFVANHEHRGHFHEADDDNPDANLPDALPPDFQPDAEEKKDQAQVGQNADGVDVLHRPVEVGKGAEVDSGKGEGADNHASQQVTENLG